MLSQRDETGSGTPIIISATRPHVMDTSDRKKVKNIHLCTYLGEEEESHSAADPWTFFLYNYINMK